jgi:hypothetical protein
MFKSLTGYTDNLELKVDILLRRQEEEFFKSYKTHFTKIREEMIKLESVIADQQKKIDDYENEGALSIMIKKSNALEKELIQCYQRLEVK